MALKSPLMPSPTTLPSAFSPFTDSPHSPFPNGAQSFAQAQAKRSSGQSQTDSLAPPPSPYPQFVDPSPVDSNGTSIEDDGQDDSQDESPHRPDTNEPVKETSWIEDAVVASPSKDNPDAKSPAETLAVTPLIISPTSPASSSASKFSSVAIDTSVGSRLRSDSEGAPLSVIHAPADFGDFGNGGGKPGPRVTPSPSAKSDNTIVSPHSPDTPEAQRGPPIPIRTSNLPVAKGLDRPTPRAQTRQEAEEWKREKVDKSSSLEDIPEGQDIEKTDEEIQQPSESGSSTISHIEEYELQVQTLNTALNECWTLCTTLAGLSSNQRSRTHSYRSKPFAQEHAWKTCWKLCQSLYDSRDEDHTSHMLPTLEMCKEFCNALFEVRLKHDELADSVLRVSFELNNHLYNTHDRNLPIAFQERTLDFYLTLCHRLMKQRTSLPLETDALLRACWNLTEILFSMRQNKQEGESADEDLLSSAVQACWDLCDLFREGWSQIRPDRGTPRPSQAGFSDTTSYRSQSAYSARSSTPSIAQSSTRSFRDAPVTRESAPPETPTTIFDDINDSMDSEDEINVPNILVLGPEATSSGGSSYHNRWDRSNASVAYSDGSSQRSSVTAGSQADSRSQSSEVNLHRIRVLLVQAAIGMGFVPRSPPPTSSSASASGRHSQHQSQALLNFVKALPSNSFGPQPWQSNALVKYRRLVLNWPGANRPTIIPATPRRVVASEIARAVQWMQQSERYTWLRDLFRVVFGCYPDDDVSLLGKVIVA